MQPKTHSRGTTPYIIVLSLAGAKIAWNLFYKEDKDTPAVFLTSGSNRTPKAAHRAAKSAIPSRIPYELRGPEALRRGAW